MLARIFLAAVGGLYAYLAWWCSVSPGETSQLVGFQLVGGSGRSEFLTVYGGLEAGMAAIFLLPLLRPALQYSALLNCTLIHLGLVAFRTAGFVLFTDIQTMTMKLAAGEWLILILSGLLLWKSPKGKR
ncbi:MAG: hypothetical protein RLZZ536_2428 [Planctomycetota bacterium]|jgi:hypothetical protein